MQTYLKFFLFITFIFSLPAIAFEHLGDRYLKRYENIQENEVAPGTPKYTYTELTADQESYLQGLLAQIQKQKLYLNPYWLKIMHYKKGLFGYQSEVRGKFFFNAPDGSRNPKSELEYTLTALFKGDLHKYPFFPHPRCIFRRRLHWLKDQLNMDLKRLPKVSCKAYDDWLHSLDPSSVSIVFASFYMGSPASMFGHTFLKLNKSSNENSYEILDYGINFSAAVTPEQLKSPLNTFMGLLGFYPGRYEIFPYYLKTHEYNDIDNRDLWEYKLNFTKEEIERILEHYWELRVSYYPYYFLKKNCSYHLLSLVEAARPDMDLTDAFGVSVIPTDTLLVLKKKKLIVSDKIRLSKRSLYLYYLSSLSQKQKTMFEQLIRDKADLQKNTSFNNDEKIQILDTATTYLSYKIAVEADKKKTAPLSDQYNRLLAERSKLPVKKEEVKIPYSTTNPLDGHYSSRLSLQGGLGYDKNYFFSVTYRPAYHSLSDPWKGYSPFSAIEFLSVKLRYKMNVQDPLKDFGQNIWLSKFKIVHITALNPVHSYLAKASYDIDTGFGSFMERENINKNYFYVKGSFGLSFQPFDKGFLRQFIFFVSPTLNLRASDFYRYFVSGAAGLQAGILLRFGYFFTLYIDSHFQYWYDFGSLSKTWETKATVNLGLSRWLSLSAFASYDYFKNAYEYSGAIHFYFRN